MRVKRRRKQKPENSNGAEQEQTDDWRVTHHERTRHEHRRRLGQSGHTWSTHLNRLITDETEDVKLNLNQNYTGSD